MKRLVIILLSLLALTSCHKKIWDKLNDHEARITKLEQFCNQLNTNINSLQSIVNVIYARDYVKDVVPVTENGTVIGYTITFNSNNPITIFNGKNGEDAHTPLIGIKKDTDDIWYWTMDGEWILDSDGNKVRADGLTPQLKIEDDYWWVSYDSGSTWSKLGKAVGNQGEGDSMFQDVRQDNKYVYLILADGEVITIAKGGGLTWVYV
ncbi:MAG: hypothetical protein J5675_00620 [Bacteroidales bacterium]|nr:hypothetical protein [Bacteroidales bacterium]